MQLLQISEDFMDRNAKYLQPRMISLSNRFVCSFVKKELPQGPQKSKKKSYILYIFVFYNAIFVKVLTISSIRTLKRFNNN